MKTDQVTSSRTSPRVPHAWRSCLALVALAFAGAARSQEKEPLWSAKGGAAPPTVAPVAKTPEPFEVKPAVPSRIATPPRVEQAKFQETPKLEIPKEQPPAGPAIAPPGPAVPAPAKLVDPNEVQSETIKTKPKQLPGRIVRTPDEDALLTAARSAVEQQKYDIAVERFERYLAKRPDDLDIRKEYAGVLVSAGEPRRAAVQYEKIIAADPENMEYRLFLGNIYIIAKDYRRAVAQFTALLEQNAKTTDARLRQKNEQNLALNLARAYAYDGDYSRAEMVYDRYLATVRPEDPTAPVALGGLLLDLERPNEALAYLLAQRKRIRTELDAKNEDVDVALKEGAYLDVLAGLVRAYARLGERQIAMEVLTEMAGVQPKRVLTRIVLGDSLFAAEEFEIAGHVYNQVLQADPSNGNALIGIARVHLAMFLPCNAKKILDSFIPGAAVQRAYLLTYSEYHQKVGEYTEAKQIYKDMLRRNELDHEVRLSLGMIYDYTKEWEKAKAEFAKIPPTTPVLGKKARLAFAVALYNQRKFQEAVDVDRTMLAEDPNDYQVIAQTVRHMAKAGQCDQAIALARAYLATNPRSEAAALAVRLALAKVLLESKRALDASREYEIILSRPVGRIPATYYGLARASEMMGNTERASQLIGCIVGVLGGDTRQRMLLADLYSEDYADARVIELCLGALQYDQTNLAVLIRLADAYQRSARYDARVAPAFDACIRILNLSPTNTRGHLCMSRTFSIAQNYRKSCAQYDQLIQIDPDFTIPPRERARVLFSDHQFSAARSQYQAMLSPGPDQVLLSGIQGVVTRQPATRIYLEPYLATSLSGPTLRREMEKVASTLADEDSKLAVLRLVNDYDAKVAEQTAFRLEMEAKELKDYRNYLALPAYDCINRYEPTNTETLFDLGQVYGALRMTRNALEMYQGTIAVDPTHRDAMVAQERAGAELSPRYDGGYNYFRQRGRDGRASINRETAFSAATLPWGDENEYFQVGYMRAMYTPVDGPLNSGNIPFIRAQKKFDDNKLLLYGQLNYETFSYGFQNRPTFDAGFQYDHDDCLRTRGGFYSNNVAECGESMRQDIHREGVYAGFDVHMSRVWNFGGTYRYGHYSDNNNMNALDLYNEVSLSLPPKQLKLVQKYMFMGYSDQSIFPTDPPNPYNLFGMIHPYFSPKSFNYIESRIEWWHWFSRDYFVHSDQCWYSLQYGLGTDDRLVTYNNFRGIINYDICSWLTIGASTGAQLSSVYKNFDAYGFITVRFP